MHADGKVRDDKKKGCAPVCANEWREGNCKKPTVRCHDIATLPEISRSGDGAHAWFFFDNPVPAEAARLLATALIDKTCREERLLSLSSHDRLILSQDTLTGAGFRSLIALPRALGDDRTAADAQYQFLLLNCPHYFLSHWHELERVHRSTWKIARFVDKSQSPPQHVRVPRGCADRVLKLCEWSAVPDTAPEALIQEVLTAVSSDLARTAMLATEAVGAWRLGHKVLILTERRVPIDALIGATSYE